MKYFQVYSRHGCMVRPDESWMKNVYAAYSCPCCGVILPQHFGKQLDVVIGEKDFREDHPQLITPVGHRIGVYGCDVIAVSRELLDVMESFEFKGAIGTVSLGHAVLASYVSANAALHSRVSVEPNKVIRADTVCASCGRALQSADGNAGYHLVDHDVCGRDVMVSKASFRIVLSDRVVAALPALIRRSLVYNEVGIWDEARHHAVWKNLD